MIKKFYVCCCLLGSILIYAQGSAAEIVHSEVLIVHVYLNGSDAGKHFIESTGNDFLITRELLEKIGVPSVPQEIVESKSVLLSSLHDWLSYSLDTQTGDLFLTVNPELLPTHEQSLLVKQESGATWIQSDAVFLNYTLDYTVNPDDKNVLTAPLELGLSLNGTSLINQFTYNDKLFRTKTQWVYDDQNSLRRWVVGDVQASSGYGVGGASLAGLRVYRNFSMDANLVTTPGLETSILLDTASEVEVFMDGNSVYKGQFPAGLLKLKDIPFYRSGSVQAELIVRDSFGREQHYNQLLYGSVGLLAEGLSEYDYALGVERTTVSLSDPSYGDKPMIYGSYRYGMRSWFTPSIGFESDGRYGRLSMGSSVLLGQYGQLDSLIGVSELNQGSGHYFQARYNYVGSEFFSPSVFFNTTSVNYGGILDVQPSATSSFVKHREFGGSLSSYYKTLGGVTARWSKSEDFENNTIQTGALLFNTNLPQNVSLTAQLTRTWEIHQNITNQMSASLGHSFSNGLYLSANYSSDTQVDTFSLQLQWTPPLGKGLGVTSNVTQQGSDNPTTYSRVSYQNQYAEASLSGSTGTQNTPYQMQLNSALVWTEGGLHVSRPVRDSFALVRVKGIKDGMKVNLRSQYVGETDADGELLIPYTYAYTDNAISIDTEGISLGYKISNTSQNVTMPYRGGGLVEFEVVKLQMVEGTLFYKIGNTLQNAQYSTLEYMQGGKKLSTVLGDGGALYLENLSPGTHEVTVFDDVHRCHVNLQVPDSDHMLNDIGRIICVVGEEGKGE